MRITRMQQRKILKKLEEQINTLRDIQTEKREATREYYCYDEARKINQKFREELSRLDGIVTVCEIAGFNDLEEFRKLVIESMKIITGK